MRETNDFFAEKIKIVEDNRNKDKEHNKEKEKIPPKNIKKKNNGC